MKAEFKCNSDSEIRRYLQWLIDNNLTYHFDDSIDDIVWAEATPEQVETIRIANERLHSFCDIWEWFDKNEGMFDKYIGRSYLPKLKDGQDK